MRRKKSEQTYLKKGFWICVNNCIRELGEKKTKTQLLVRIY